MILYDAIGSQIIMLSDAACHLQNATRNRLHVLCAFVDDAAQSFEMT